ncbi:MAG: YwaF family protein [Acholeplasmataceae bacterium]|nr:YwaF family protein [Acholeplasmataceae bacterium]
MEFRTYFIYNCFRSSNDFLGIFLGFKYRNNRKVKRRTIIVAAISINAIEIFKIIILSIRNGNVLDTILQTLPLFLCSIMLIALPLAAFTKGKLKEASLDLVLIFGFIGGTLGTIGAAHDYNNYPVLSIDNFASAITHCIAAFSSIFIGITKMASLKTKNMWIGITILLGVATLAQIANLTIPHNYMFLESDDGTPYVIVTTIVNGNKILYKSFIVGLLVLLILIFYTIKIIVDKKAKKQYSSVYF